MGDQDRLTEALSDRYRIEHEIGSGGMATVYLARDLKHDRKVAVKVLHPEMAQAVGPVRFLREIRTAANLDHPHILPVFDSGDVEGFLFYIMPFVRDGSLQARLEREKQLPIEDAIRITRQIADALTFAHEEGVVHRDIKPANIMLKAGYAVLADFGVAHAVAQAQDERITQTGATVGTPTYMSPEQASGERDVDGRADQYALACVLYEMLTGTPPFRGALGEAVVRQHLTADPVPVMKIRPSVPEGVTQALSQALSKTPADRFNTVSEFGRSLGRRAEGGWGAVPPRHIQRNPGLRGMASSVSRALSGHLVKAGAVLVALSLLFLAQWFGGGDQPPTLSALAERELEALAVVPIQRAGTDETTQDLTRISAQEIHQVMNGSGVFASRGGLSVEKLLDLPITTGQLADSLGVEKLIEVSVESRGGGAGERLQLHIEVTDAHTGALESPDDSHHYPLDPDSLYEDAARFATEFVSDYLSRFPRPGFAGVQGRTVEGPGHEAYLAGARLLGQRTATALRDAREAFEDAIRQDPENPHALSGLSKYYGLSETYRYRTGVDGYQTAGLALALARRAIELDSTLANGYAARSYMTRRAHAPGSLPEAACREALRLDPGGAETLSWCAYTLREQGDEEAAYRAARQGVERDPYNAGRRVGLALMEVANGNYEAAETEARAAWEFEPEMMFPRAIEAWALLLADHPETCLERTLGPHAVIRATCLQEMGRRDEASAIVDSVEAALAGGVLPDDDFGEVVRTADLAVFYARLGDLDGALSWIRRSFSLTPSGIEKRFLESALFDRVRPYPGFGSEVERIQAGIWERARTAGEASYQELFGNSR